MDMVSIPAAAAVVCTAIVAAVVVAVILWAPWTPARMLALALASAAGTGGAVAVVASIDRRKGATPTAVPAVPAPPDLQAPLCGPREEHGALLAPLDERTHEATLHVERRRFGGG